MRFHTRACIAAWFLLTTEVVADNWPQWRGPNAKGIAVDGDYPVKFSADDVTWKVELPGLGSSSPVVWDDAIFVTCLIDGEDAVVRYDFEGEEVWRKTLGEGRAGKHKNGSGSNPSPATDGKHVVTYFKSGRVVCHEFDGNELWQKNLQDEYGKDTLWWDLGSSPVIVGDKVVIAVMQSGDSYLVAFDLAGGEEVWKQKRQYVRPEESDHAYTTPQIAKIGGRDVIVTRAADYLTGHDAATGEQLWEKGPFNPKDEANWHVIASHAMDDGVAVVPYGRGDFLAGVQLGASGNEPKVLWEEYKRKFAADVPTPIIRDGEVYVLNDQGKVFCRDLKSGEERWAGALPEDRDKYYASPVLAGDKLYCTREDGVMFAASIDGGLKVLAENDMGEQIIATPAPVRGGLLVRGAEHLFWIGGGSEQPAG